LKTIPSQAKLQSGVLTTVRRVPSPVGVAMRDEKGKKMTEPGPSKEYRDLLNGDIEPDEYVREVKKDVDRTLEEHGGAVPREEPEERRAAAR
jgi:hypothetical protein